MHLNPHRIRYLQNFGGILANYQANVRSNSCGPCKKHLVGTCKCFPQLQIFIDSNGVLEYNIISINVQTKSCPTPSSGYMFRSKFRCGPQPHLHPDIARCLRKTTGMLPSSPIISHHHLEVDQNCEGHATNQKKTAECGS